MGEDPRIALEMAEALRERLRVTGRRLDALAQSLRDETWHARAPGAAPDPELDRALVVTSKDLERDIDRDLALLKARLAAFGERTK